MKLLTVPNWSFSGHKDLLGLFHEVIEEYPLILHYLQADVDHNRTVLAFSGLDKHIFAALKELCCQVLPEINLSTHHGVHPRLGALDVCPFIPLEPYDFAVLNKKVKSWAKWLASKFKIPVFLYEKSSPYGYLLPFLRKNIPTKPFDEHFHPDHGPWKIHSLWGVSITGIRNFLIAMNINLDTPDLAVARTIARKIREKREHHEDWALGVRALGFLLKSKNLAQVSINLTRPDDTSPDQVITKVQEFCAELAVKIHSTELIGVIRQSDLPSCTLLPVDHSQLVQEI